MNFLLGIAKFLVIVYFSAYALVHVLLFITPETMRYVIFMNHIKWGWKDLTNPTNFGQKNVHNFYLDTDVDIRVGIWHYIPAPLDYQFERDSKKSFKEHFDTFIKPDINRPIVIYVHGNDGDRADGPRIKLCSTLCGLGYHVFAIDYRGYGDSTGFPSEKGVVNDVLALYNFLKSYKKDSKIFFWGHSLGTGISCHAAKTLSEFNSPPAGVILEAPFYNISQAAKEYVISPLFLNNPYSIKMAEDALEELEIRFNNAENILKIKSKVIIFHAEDDWLIPQDRSRDILKLSNSRRSKEYPPVKLIEYEKALGLGHNNIYTHQELYPLIREFIETD